MTTRATKTDPWGPPENLDPPVNTSSQEAHPHISADGLSLYFADVTAPGYTPTRPGGYGGGDIWVTELKTGRQETELVWSEPKNLGATINSSAYDAAPCISNDGLVLFFHSERIGGYGSIDIWVTRRETPDDPWEEPFNLGPLVNTSLGDGGPALSTDGKTLYFMSGETQNFKADLYQAPIIPIVDFNSDGIVNSADMVIMVDNWGTDNSLCDVGPMPWGDGIVDVQDLIVLAEHLFEELPPAEEIE
jgi:Tol biopolymer transport system component